MNAQPASIGRRQALALAAALTLAVGTAVAAVGGIAHTPRSAPAPSPVATPVLQAAAPAHEDDD
jgi:hypothetical protein